MQMGGNIISILGHEDSLDLLTLTHDTVLTAIPVNGLKKRAKPIFRNKVIAFKLDLIRLESNTNSRLHQNNIQH